MIPRMGIVGMEGGQMSENPVCPYCDETFVRNRQWQKFCCTDHQQRWHLRNRNGNGDGKQIDLGELGFKLAAPVAVPSLNRRGL
jgi:hypothetical protein